MPGVADPGVRVVMDLRPLQDPDRAGARIVEVPIVFPDRRVGQSKMSGGIFKEAISVVLRLRWDELRGRGPTARMTRPPASGG